MMAFMTWQIAARGLRGLALAALILAMPALAVAEIGGDETAREFDPAQQEAVRIVNTYLNSFIHLEGDFTQVAPDSQVSEGRFFLRRPGRVRFDYTKPDRLLVIADGFWIGVVDRKLRTLDRYPIISTPYWALLKDEVDLRTDARILSVERDAGLILVAIDDPSGQAAGSLTLIFEEVDDPTGHVGDSALRLSQWLVTDAQGLTTSVAVKNLVEGRQARNNMFTLRQYER